MAQRLTEPHFLLHQDDKPIALCRIISVGITGVLVDLGNVELSTDANLKIEFIDPRRGRCCRCLFPVAVGVDANDHVTLDFGDDAPDWLRRQWRNVVTCFLVDL